MQLVLGLGNPGERYRRTRHNVAWWVLDALAERWQATGDEVCREYRSVRAFVADREVVLIKPLTFMNLSGEALQGWQQRHGPVAEDLLVVSDDVYLPLGSIRIRPRGSSGGHRGLESLEQALGSREFARLRLGVGTAIRTADLKEHVLDEFASEEQPTLDEMVRLAAEAVECWVHDGTLSAMNQFNRKVRKEVPES
ncbi:MAG: aminoacyl-tRNA hydrolase [Candidatus Eisenbacteria bacterium]